MKKIILIAIISLVGFNSHGQGTGFHIGAGAGWSVGDSSELLGFTFNLESNYLWPVSDKTLVGISFSYIQYIKVESILIVVGYLPANYNFMSPASAVRHAVSDLFFVGADVGYAIGISPSENKGGFYYRPLIGINFKDNRQWTLSYRGITRGGLTFSSITLGRTYTF